MQPVCLSGGIGRRARLKIVYRKVCRFDSGLRYKSFQKFLEAFFFIGLGKISRRYMKMDWLLSRFPACRSGSAGRDSGLRYKSFQKFLEAFFFIGLGKISRRYIKMDWLLSRFPACRSGSAGRDSGLRYETFSFF